jgi:hypothetical protein
LENLDGGSGDARAGRYSAAEGHTDIPHHKRKIEPGCAPRANADAKLGSKLK